MRSRLRNKRTEIPATITRQSHGQLASVDAAVASSVRVHVFYLKTGRTKRYVSNLDPFVSICRLTRCRYSVSWTGISLTANLFSGISSDKIRFKRDDSLWLVRGHVSKCVCVCFWGSYCSKRHVPSLKIFHWIFFLPDLCFTQNQRISHSNIIYKRANLWNK